jgi:hypothetical protein
MLNQLSPAWGSACSHHAILTPTWSGLRLEVLVACVLHLQDAKGKIRVYCRVRPLLEFEKNKRQVS